MLHHLTTNPIYCFFVHIIGFIVVYFVKSPIAVQVDLSFYINIVKFQVRYI